MAGKNTKTGNKANKGKQPVWQGRRQARGPLALGPTITRLTKPIFGQRGFAANEIVTDWPRIAGPEFAAVSLPERIAFPTNKRTGGTLHLRVQPGGHAIDIQHMAPQLIDRINTYFGYGAVREVRIVQAPLPARPHPEPAAAPPAQPLLPDSDDPLEQALTTLGQRVRAKLPPDSPKD